MESISKITCPQGSVFHLKKQGLTKHLRNNSGFMRFPHFDSSTSFSYSVPFKNLLLSLHNTVRNCVLLLPQDLLQADQEPAPHL